MNAYDFDETIYRGDSTRDFVLWAARHNARALCSILGALPAGALFVLGRMDKTSFKQRLLSFVRHLDMDWALTAFWTIHRDRIKPFYLAQKRPDDLIASASPEFLLRPVLESLGVTNVVASRVDPKTGAFAGPNCWGGEKLRQLEALGLAEQIGDFYSDSLSDAPLARVARRAFLVTGDSVAPWPEG